MTGPSSTPRPRVDQLTDDMLDQLYAERDQLAIRVWNAEDASTAWERKADEQHTRANTAEAELAENTGVIQTLRRQRDEAEASRDAWAAEAAAQTLRAEKVEAAIARVRAELTAIEADVHGQHDEDDDGMREAVRRILAALDGTT